MQKTIAYRPKKRTDLSPRGPNFTVWGSSALVAHFVSYRGVANVIIKQDSIFSLVVYKPCTTIPVFYSTSSEDCTAVEDFSQWGFKAYNSPSCLRKSLVIRDGGLEDACPAPKKVSEIGVLLGQM